MRTQTSPSSLATKAGAICRSVVSSIADAVTIADPSPSQRQPSIGAPVGNLGLTSTYETVALLIDNSSSMRERFEGAADKLAAAKMGAATFILEKYRHHPHDAVGVISFCSAPTVLTNPLPVRSAKAQLLRAISPLAANGGTNITKALEAAEEMLLIKHVAQVPRIVLLTDGHGGNARQVAQRLKDSGVTIQCVGVGNDPSAVDEALLHDIASTIDGCLQYVFVRNLHSLMGTYTGLSALGVLK